MSAQKFVCFFLGFPALFYISSKNGGFDFVFFISCPSLCRNELLKQNLLLHLQLFSSHFICFFSLGICLGWLCFHHKSYTITHLFSFAHGTFFIPYLCWYVCEGFFELYIKFHLAEFYNLMCLFQQHLR